MMIGKDLKGSDSSVARVTVLAFEKAYRKSHSGQLMPQLLNYINNLLNYCCTDLLGRRH
jgi:hypothetical protein